MAYLEGLTWGSQDALGETRAGMPIYSGTAHGLAEWSFKVRNRARVLAVMQDEEQKAVKLATLISQVIEGLTDDALKVAMDMNEQQLSNDNAVETLITSMESYVSQFKKFEARELYKIGSKTSGPLTRQHGEPMRSYVTRRKRWYTRLRLLDSGITVSEPLLVEQLLDCAMLTEEQKLSLRTITSNSEVFDTVAENMRKLFHDVEKKESKKQDLSTSMRRGGQRPRNANTFRSLGRKGWQSRSSGGGFRPRAHVAEAVQSDEEVPAPPCAWTVVESQPDASSDQAEDDEEDNIYSYNVVTCIAPDDFECIEDQIAMDVVVAYLAAGADVEEPEHAEMIAEQFDTQLTAFYGREDARARGVKVARNIHDFRPRSEMSIEDRKAALAKAKANSRCKKCGKKGHWKGDPQCGKEQRPGQDKKHGLMAKSVSSSFRKSPGQKPAKAHVFIADPGGEDRAQSEAPMPSGLTIPTARCRGTCAYRYWAVPPSGGRHVEVQCTNACQLHEHDAWDTHDCGQHPTSPEPMPDPAGRPSDAAEVVIEAIRPSPARALAAEVDYHLDVMHSDPRYSDFMGEDYAAPRGGAPTSSGLITAEAHADATTPAPSAGTSGRAPRCGLDREILDISPPGSEEDAEAHVAQGSAHALHEDGGDIEISDDDSYDDTPEVEITSVIPPPQAAQAAVVENDQKFDFGSNRGKTFKEVTESRPGCFFWTLTQRSPSPYLANYICWVERNYAVDSAVQSLTSKSNLSSYRAESSSAQIPHTPHKQARDAVRRE